MKVWKKGIILVVLLILIVPSVSAWCLGFIGNTCGDRSTNPDSPDYLNFDKPEEGSKDIGVQIPTVTPEWRPFKSSPFEESDNDFTGMEEGDSRNAKADDGELYSMKFVDSQTSTVSDTEGLFYDVDLGLIEMRCPACVTVDGKPAYTAGFDYLFDLHLINTGNTPSQGVQMEVKVETLGQIKHYNFNDNALILDTGGYILEGLRFPKFGVLDGVIQSEYIYDGVGLQTYPMTVTATLYNSNGVTEPRIQVIKITKRFCGGKGEDFHCDYQETFETKKFCPNGNAYSGLYSCNLDDPSTDNNLLSEFTLDKLTADLNSRARVGILP